MARPSNADQEAVDREAEEVHPSASLPERLHVHFYELVSQYEFRAADVMVLETYLRLADEVNELRKTVDEPGFNRLVVTSKGDLKSHPLIEQLRGAERQLRYYVNELGTSPGSRTKAPKRKTPRAAPTSGKAKLRQVV